MCVVTTLQNPYTIQFQQYIRRCISKAGHSLTTPQLIALSVPDDELSGWLRNEAPSSRRQADSLMLGSDRRAPRPAEGRES